MRVLEVIVILVILAAAGGILFGKRDRRLNAALLLSVVLVALLHGIIDQFRVQMVPAYAVALVLIIVLIRRLFKPHSEARSKALLKKSLLSIVVLAVSGVSVYLSMLLPVFSMPEPTGSYAIGTISRHLTDQSRGETFSADPNDKRELMVNVWYPVDRSKAEGKPVEHYPSELGEAISLVFGIPKQLFSHVTAIPTHVVNGAELSTAKANYPVLLFSPGVRSTRFQSMTAIEELVSHGYIVVGMDHPYTSAKVTFPDGRAIFYEPEPKFPTAAELYENNVKGVGIRAADARFVLDIITQWNTKDPNGLFEGKLDLDHVGIFGHSYGGATTAEALAQDKRFKAGLSLEGGFWGSVAHTGLQQPFMYIMSGGTAESLDPSTTKKDKVFYEEFAPDLKSVMTKSTNDTYYLTVDHFIHQSFTEIALLSPSLFAKNIDPVHNIDITRSYVRAFFDQYLKGNSRRFWRVHHLNIPK
ncbi:carboxylic ester hydrolase [Paenibacillus baekrokdamisoli]|uniref:Carboxylic ester hydrolase n=1 Tax=Paenibacillus baekrokdamisoli TaxID=1712516 RepID=A0A3G9JBZ9_9BACL|nr:prolyl oligopeptidase family serine peptidase [Paenibacillus baekrokdamisoli]MBB3068608.1 putative dienelactone hydrolase [Paenibacillus baekrokdamisoli]BBH23441.1 carboxylic ester hydrolase [Paenibacillus baekrokdamisoli]